MRGYHDPELAPDEPEEPGSWGRDVPEDLHPDPEMFRVFEDGRWMSWAEWAVQRPEEPRPVAQPETSVSTKTREPKKRKERSTDPNQTDLF